MTNKTRIMRLETCKTKALYNKHVSTLPVEAWTRSLDALANALHVTRAELERELQRLNQSAQAQG